jgi:hypothetical protein
LSAKSARDSSPPEAMRPSGRSDQELDPVDSIAPEVGVAHRPLGIAAGGRADLDHHLRPAHAELDELVRDGLTELPCGFLASGGELARELRCLGE